MRSCDQCQYKVIGYEHAKVCDKLCRLIIDVAEANNCKYYKEFNRWDKEVNIGD